MRQLGWVRRLVFCGTAVLIGAMGTPRAEAVQRVDAPAATDEPLLTAATFTSGEGASEGVADLIKLLDAYTHCLSRQGDQTQDAWLAIVRSLERLAARHPGSITARRANLVAADAMARAGRTAEAIARLAQLKDQHPMMADWVRWRIAVLDPEQAQPYLTELIARYPDSPLLPEARLQLALSLREPDVQLAALRAIARQEGAHPSKERALAALIGHPKTDARQWLTQYWQQFPQGPEIRDVAKRLSALDKLNPTLRLELGHHFYNNNDYVAAKNLYASVATPWARYRLARTYWGLDDLKRAVAILTPLTQTEPKLRARVYLTLGQIEAQRGRRSEALGAYAQTAKLGGEWAPTALWKSIRLLRAIGDPKRVKDLEQALLSRYPLSEEAGSLLWSRVHERWKRGDYRGVAADAQRFGDTRSGHATALAAQYWSGRAYERLGRIAEARGVYGRVLTAAPTSYYGWRSQFRMTALKGRARDPWFKSQPGATANQLSVRWSDLLAPDERKGANSKSGIALPRTVAGWPAPLREQLFLRQFDALAVQALPKHDAEVMAWLSYFSQRYRQAIALAPTDSPLRYPLGFEPMIQAAARQHQVDPLLLAALVREESRYDPVVRSWVGATGLAQLMPSTAQWVASQIGGVDAGKLTDPATNLRLGSWYLAYTHRVFGGDSLLAVAAYNGGPGAAGKWRKQFGGEPDEFVENIPYDETREYVRKVFSSYWNYQRLYRPS